ncbi:MAG: aminodeoxychorismate/anthranilate synthase component II [Planctomycetota bacterium]|nr:aminodeoxychorismate/anthranilate synthase component II [Planctomycetota bacterium]
MPADLLVVDNYDSFTHNAVDLLTQLGARTEVVRNDAVSVADVAARDWRGIVLSPGPGRPRDAGICVELVKRLGARVPILGICLGHQAIARAYGGRIVRAVRPLHGTATEIRGSRRGLLRALPARFEAARYHSLVVDPNRPGRDLRVTCRSAEGEIMGLMHARHPVEGVQFHPESYLSPVGPALLAAFLRRCGLRPRSAARVVR